MAMMDYDCTKFDKLGWCMGFQARYSAMAAMHTGAGVLTIARQLTPQVRIGAFVDYQPAERASAAVKATGERPTFGAFAVYNANADLTGLQAKVTGAFNTSKADVTRGVLPDTEAGHGVAGLTTYAVGGELSWGFALDGAKLMVSPYAGVRSVNITRGAYTEQATDDVTFPISYGSYYQHVTAATLGVRLNGALSDKVGYQLGMGGEFDLNHRNSAYTGTSTIPGLETFALANVGSSRRARANASAGLSYDLDKTQRLSANVSVRQQAFSSKAYVSTMVGYQVAF